MHFIMYYLMNINAKDAVDVLMARGKTHEMEDLTNVLVRSFTRRLNIFLII